MYAANKELERKRREEEEGGGEGKNREIIVLVTPSSCPIKLETGG